MVTAGRVVDERAGQLRRVLPRVSAHGDGGGERAGSPGWNESRRTTESLPLSRDPQRPRLDFIVFLVDITSSESLAMLGASLALTHPSYFAGRSCIVVSHSTRWHHLRVLCVCVRDRVSLCAHVTPDDWGGGVVVVGS